MNETGLELKKHLCNKLEMENSFITDAIKQVEEFKSNQFCEFSVQDYRKLDAVIQNLNEAYEIFKNAIRCLNSY